MGTKPREFVEIRAARFGAKGCHALVQAFIDAPTPFTMEVLIAAPHDQPEQRFFLVTIGETTTALAPADLRWLADVLISAPDEVPVPLANDFRRFGRLLLDVANDLSPGAHGAH